MNAIVIKTVLPEKNHMCEPPLYHTLVFQAKYLY